ncbi:MAG TPA: cytochrome d ubiquinol oxidase subunit II [Candidatus Nanopelagicales bacterium]|nr:cytochrome d ubiquinol oxidase subunit II [Candidatus Nanopelagicales bacterium]
MDTLWFVIVAVFWTGFFVLEGFDFGVGMLHRWLGRSETERRVAINAIGPTWDGNEVWLIVAAAGMFAAFPGWYATWFSALYLVLVLVLVSLIIRGVSFEFRGKRDSVRWRGTWSWTLTVGSALAPLLFGVGLGDLLAGLPVDADQEFTGSFGDLLTPYGLVFGVTLVLLCLVHGGTFLGLKVGDPLRSRAQDFTARLSWVSLVAVVVTAVWTYNLSGRSPLSLVLAVAALGGAVAAALLARDRREGLAFTATTVTIAASVGSIFAGLYPNVLVSSTAAANNLTIANASSQQYALQVMSVVALVCVPVVLLYQGWAYYVFRTRLRVPPEVSRADAAGTDARR